MRWRQRGVWLRVIDMTYVRIPKREHSSKPRQKRPVAIAGLVLVLALAGCTGLPQFQTPDAGSNGGGGSQGGLGQPGVQEGAGWSSGPSGPASEPEPAPMLDTPLPDDIDAQPILAAAPEVATPLPGWLVQFSQETSKEEMQQMTKERGGTFVFAFQSLPIAYIQATDGQADKMSRDSRVLHIEREVAIEFHDAESRTAIRIPQVIHPVTGLRDAAGNPIDGRGVGIAVVDSGIDALHPDLPYGPTVPGGVVAANYKVLSQKYIPLQNTDTTVGHGTHVAAIIAGQGIAQASVKGVAPGARLYGLAIGEVSTTVWSAQAFDWILQNHASVNPPIKVVTNSWGTTGAYNPSSTTSLFVNAMVNQGLTVVFSAGNNGGTGSVANTSSECQNPTAGVICVAAYDDLGTGTRNGNIATYSSRGATATPATWPDISAPGSNVLSARPPAGTVTGAGFDLNYVQLSGTSQAAPHVTAVVALMLQRHPGLSPATVESTLESNAYKFTDGGAYSASGGHHAKGAGLVDAYAAVAAV